MPEGVPRILLEDGRVNARALRPEAITRTELGSIARDHGCASLRGLRLLRGRDRIAELDRGPKGDDLTELDRPDRLTHQLLRLRVVHELAPLRVAVRVHASRGIIVLLVD